MLSLNEVVPTHDEKYEEELRQKHKDEGWLFEASRRDIIRRTFLATADATYVTARWQFFNKLDFEFLWNATHALEKYFKAALLLNNIKANDLSHDITKAFYRTQDSLGADLLPNKFPTVLTERIAHITSGDRARQLRYDGPEAYVKSLNWQGGAEARYAMSSHTVATTDLYCFDLTAFLVRRLVENLQRCDKIDELRTNPEACPSRYGLLEEIYTTDDHPLRPTLGRVNYFLNPAPDTSKALPVGVLGFRSANSAMYNHIVEKAESNRSLNRAVSKRLTQWAIDSLPGIKTYKSELQKYL
ncbi:hypothetical protein [uncultured Hyphomonas sp.]|uniref:hypothetical protein n=1 Tax=uncultured Hyphomonas sp. TaxID=225298 RepID=UPI002AAC0373|nr:hypothetical protein [uncultured Hyphomonas sp.]